MVKKWLFLKIKQNICSLVFWLILLISVLFIIMTGYARRRMEEKRTVVVTAEEGELPEKLMRELLNSNLDGYEFQVVEDEEELQLAVVRGCAYCGIVLTEDLQAIETGELRKDAVVLYCSADSGAADVLQELIFPYLLKAVSTPKLKEYYENVGLSETDAAYTAVMNANEQLLQEYQLHLCDVKTVDADSDYVHKSSPDANADYVYETSDIKSNASGEFGYGGMKLWTFLALMVLIFGVTVWEEQKQNRSFLRTRIRTERILLPIESGIIRCLMIGIITLLVTLNI